MSSEIFLNNYLVEIICRFVILNLRNFEFPVNALLSKCTFCSQFVLCVISSRLPKRVTAPRKTRKRRLRSPSRKEPRSKPRLPRRLPSNKKTVMRTAARRIVAKKRRRSQLRKPNQPPRSLQKPPNQLRKRNPAMMKMTIVTRRNHQSLRQKHQLNLLLRHR